MKVFVGIPAYNEEKNIGATITKLKKVTNKIIVCNDGSSDLTEDISKGLGAIVVSHSSNLGYGTAIQSILKKAREEDADILITFDADGQHRIEDIQKVIKPIIDNEVDIVIGSRFLEKQNEIPSYRKFGIKTITKVANVSIKDKLTDSQSGFRAYNKKVLSAIHPVDHGMGISTEILIKASKMNFRIVEVPIKILYDGNTSTHHPLSHGTSVLFSTIKFTSIEHPLKFYGTPALIFISIGLLFTFWSAQYYTEVGRINTNLTLIAAGTILIGVVLIIAAILLYSLVSVVRERQDQ